MNNIFVFTANSPEAKKHLDTSIKNAITKEKVLSTFDEIQHQDLLKIHDEGNGFYAWGDESGSRNIFNWEKIIPGDYVLCVSDNRYRYVSQVIGKYENERFAKEVWGYNSKTGETWRYVYILNEPNEINIAVSELANYLNRGYMGFTKIGDSRVDKIIEEYDSIEAFILEKAINQKCNE